MVKRTGRENGHCGSLDALCFHMSLRFLVSVCRINSNWDGTYVIATISAITASVVREIPAADAGQLSDTFDRQFATLTPTLHFSSYRTQEWGQK